MQFGHFDDLTREYVIETPKTPYPWINYLGTEAFFGRVSCLNPGKTSRDVLQHVSRPESPPMAREQ